MSTKKDGKPPDRRRPVLLALAATHRSAVPAGFGEADYEAILDRALGNLGKHLSAHRSEQAKADRLYLRLFELPSTRRLLLLSNLRLERAWNLAHLLIEQGHARLREDCQQAVEHAELATRVSARLSERYYGPSLVTEIRARAWACLGNASRVAGRLGRADQAFHQAHLLLLEGSGEPLEEAFFLDLEASLHATRRRFPRAVQNLGRAAWLFHLVDDEHMAARARLKLAVVEVLLRRWAAAGEYLGSSVAALDPVRDAPAAAFGHLLAAAIRLRTSPWLTERARAKADLAAARRLLSLADIRLTSGVLHRIESEVGRGRPGPSSQPLLTAWPRWL